ncbi:hypothetical protein [Leucobacter soli]|uniref:hypothetical protein n=1 Tax=Leucobacter soli TaxID=2812850 RepID=UPI00361E79E1
MAVEVVAVTLPEHRPLGLRGRTAAGADDVAAVVDAEGAADRSACGRGEDLERVGGRDVPVLVVVPVVVVVGERGGAAADEAMSAAARPSTPMVKGVRVAVRASTEVGSGTWMSFSIRCGSRGRVDASTYLIMRTNII